MDSQFDAHIFGNATTRKISCARVPSAPLEENDLCRHDGKRSALDISIRGHSGITIGDASKGALTGDPGRDLLTDPSVVGGGKLLPSDKACG